MLFWILMIFVISIVPLTMIAVGIYTLKSKRIKYKEVFGFGIAKDEPAQKFAHTFFAKYYIVFGLLLLPLSIAIMSFVIYDSILIIARTVGIVCVIQGIICSSAFFITMIVTKIFVEDRSDS